MEGEDEIKIGDGGEGRKSFMKRKTRGKYMKREEGREGKVCARESR